ncbi:MAG: hypothetical protein ABFD98_07945 [Syntrophobacteraceae bacterium]|nr:hypothetical protein [Desulfobacteraceae bacterium]
MLLMNKSGRIYDVPEQIAQKYVATGAGADREAVEDMLSTLRNRSSLVSEKEPAAGCCNIYSNYCPNN